MPNHPSRIHLATEVAVGFVWGVIAGYLVVTLVVTLLATALSTLGVPLVPDLIRIFDPTRDLTGPVVVLVCALFGAYWRYAYVTMAEAPAREDAPS